MTPSGKYIGLEVKSGNAQKTKAQRDFDRRIGINNPANGIGQHKEVEVTHVLEVRR
ncbi:MAG: hypothetical protein IJX63_01080 [Lachnospiraceae bacterium]|nr:hypothetical protein [Lachnospiraceae bacterium]